VAKKTHAPKAPQGSHRCQMKDARCQTDGMAGGLKPAIALQDKVEKTKKYLNQFLFSTLVGLKNKSKRGKTSQFIQIKPFANIRKNENSINYFYFIN
jgi:hypothetical protein